MNWHTVKEAAPLIGLSEDAVYVLIASKRLGHRRVGIAKGRGKIQINDGHIAVFLESCEVPVMMEHQRSTRGAASSKLPRPVRRRGDHRPTRRPDGKPMEFF